MSLISGLLKGARNIVGGVSRTVAGVVPGPIGLVAKTVGSKLGTKSARAVIKGTALAGAGALAAGGVMGASGMFAGHGSGRRYRRINPGNTRAMRRAVRRIEAGAKLYSKFFSIKHGHIKHAPNVRLRRGRRRAA